MVKTLITLFLLVLSPLLAGAQAFTPRLPFIMSSTATTNPVSTNDLVQQQMQIAYYWNSLDLTNGVPVTNWVDRIQGIVATQPTPSYRPTSSAIGVDFSGNYYLKLTNILSMVTNGAATNISVYIICEQNVADSNVKFVALADDNTYTNTGWGPAAMYVDRSASYRWGYREPANGGGLFGNGSLIQGVLEDWALQFVSGGNCYCNGVSMASSSSGSGIFTNITGFGKTNGGPNGLANFGGSIAVIAVYTNGAITSLIASNLHYYRTNTFGGSP